MEHTQVEVSFWQANENEKKKMAHTLFLVECKQLTAGQKFTSDFHICNEMYVSIHIHINALYIIHIHA